MKLLDIEGIGPAYAATLEKEGITTTEDLLKIGATPTGRHKLAESSGLSDKLVLEWVNHADLCRIHGVGSEYADLLEAAGVDTVPELAQRNAENLAAKMTGLNETKKLVRRLPTQREVSDWITEAKTLPRVISF
jgi:predicted flap endonuclease-1-like 5' DNA nuclease